MSFSPALHCLEQLRELEDIGVPSAEDYPNV